MSQPAFVEMDRTVTLADQLGDEGGAVVLANTFVVPPEAVDAFLEAWGADAAIMKRQPGFVSTQLHRGIAGSGAFLNYAVWESVAQFRAAFGNPEFRARLSRYPDGITTSPHLFRKTAVPASAWRRAKSRWRRHRHDRRARCRPRNDPRRRHSRLGCAPPSLPHEAHQPPGVLQRRRGVH